MNRAFIIALCWSASLGCVSFHEGPLPGAPRLVTVGEEQIHLVDHDPERQRTVVLLHGFSASLDEWRELIPQLRAANFRVIALDLRGFGWSSRSAGADYSVAGQAELVRAALAARGVTRYSVVGHSWGSAVALFLAAAHPEQVARVALFNGMVFSDQQPTIFGWSRLPLLGELIFGLFYRERTDEKMALAFYDSERFVTEAAVARVEASQDRAGATAAALATIRAFDLGALQQRYRAIAQPTLLIWGRDDAVTPLDAGERLANVMPRASLVVLPRCGHLPMIELPQRSGQALLKFLAEGSR